MALVFPFVVLTMTMSGGAMGGGVASAIARALVPVMSIAPRRWRRMRY